MNRLLILSNQTNDLCELLLRQCPDAVVCPIAHCDADVETFDAICILGGTEEQPVLLPAALRCAVERARENGKRVFCEFVSSIGSAYSDKPSVTTHHRLVNGGTFADLQKGDILDGHYNEVIPYYFVPKTAEPILTYHDYLCAHDRIEMDDAAFRAGKWALWLFDRNTLVSSFRLCNFNCARLSPRESWQKVIAAIVEFLCGKPLAAEFPAPVCKHGAQNDLDNAVQKGLRWFFGADMFVDEGKNGVREGFSHLISARDGTQLRADLIRTDCTGETGGAFLLDYLTTGNQKSKAIFQNTQAFCFDYMQIHDGAHRGMVRWSEQAWETCYQDDVARAIIPTLLSCNFGGGTDYFEQATDALRYLVDTTGEDGLRVFRTDCIELNETRRNELKRAGVGTPCAHYNAYYHAALLLAARAGADRSFAEVAKTGLSAIMARYPDTQRETSETEELCRLILPLALLYEYTGEDRHRAWLYRVTKDLERFLHPAGGYAEWDTGYKATCARNDRGECALVANNGDPIVDLLYSNNWLPMGFAYAYMVTGDAFFEQKWQGIAEFLLACQITSDDKRLDGAWTRAMDMDRLESYGVPHDVGWAPCCIESGWTVAEILMGLQFMKIAKIERNQKHES